MYKTYLYFSLECENITHTGSDKPISHSCLNFVF